MEELSCLPPAGAAGQAEGEASEGWERGCGAGEWGGEWWGGGGAEAGVGGGGPGAEARGVPGEEGWGGEPPAQGHGA